MRTLKSVVWLLAAAICVSAFGAEDKVTEQDQLAIVRKVSKSLVRVEFTLRFDKGQAPNVFGWAERCPNCGGFHSVGNGEELIKQERPLETEGLLLAPGHVLASDPLIHPRFLEKIDVRYADAVVGAQIKSFCKNENAVILELAQPLDGAEPIQFDAAKSEPYFIVSYARANGAWTTSVKPMGGLLAARESGDSFIAIEGQGLIVSKDGTGVAYTTTGELALDDAWKKSPLDWPAYSAQEMNDLLQRLDKKAAAGLLRATLNFRSPKVNNKRDRYMTDDDQGNVTEMDTPAVLVDKSRVLILANMPPSVTARLERVTVHTEDGRDISGKFAGTLKDYGAFIADLDEPLEEAMEFADEEITEYRNVLVPAVEVMIQGKTRQTYAVHRRIPGFEIGWRGQKYPEVYAAQDEKLFLFDDRLRLLAIPAAHREKVSERDSYGYYDTQESLTAALYLEGVLRTVAANLDAGNVPLTEAQENRLAWMGVELQEMDRELARINKVSDLTSDGETGAVVSYVYPDSPAALAGIEPGAILLRLYVEGEPKPLDVQLDSDSYFMEGFPWDQLDQVPEEYLQQIPQPWPSAENTLTRALTDIGFGAKYKAEFFINGQKVLKDFQVVESPPHYDSSPRFESRELGLTVRDLTYEVRRFFQKAADEPGVIVSKVEPGSKGSVSGIKPYEIITHINDEPVMTVKDFERMAAGDELRLSVKRMTMGRVVKIKMPPPETVAAEPGESQN